MAFDAEKIPVYSARVEGKLEAIEKDYQEKKRAAQGKYRATGGASMKEQDGYFYEELLPAIEALHKTRCGDKKIIIDKETPIGTRAL